MMINKSNHAIKILNEKKAKLDNIHNVLEGNTWKASLEASLILYLGESSVIITRLKDLYFTKRVPAGTNYLGGTKSVAVFDDNNKNNFKDLIDNSIQHIQSHGLYKNPSKNNFLSEFNNAQIFGSLFIVAGSILSAGIFIGKLDSEMQINKVVNEKLLEKKYIDTIKTTEKLKVETLKKK